MRVECIVCETAFDVTPEDLARDGFAECPECGDENKDFAERALDELAVIDPEGKLDLTSHIPPGEPDINAPYGWAHTGSIMSRSHLALIETYSNRALCGVGIVLAGEIRPKKATWCAKCARELRKLGGDPAYVGLYEPGISDTGEDGEHY